MFTYEEIMSLNELEMTVYQYILKNKEKAGYMKIRELAEEAHVSTTTILRFCKKMGCSGYSEFKVQFKMYLKNQIEPETDIDISNLTDYLKRFKTEDYMKTIDQAALMLQQSSSIIFIGVGTSGMLAKYGSRYFSNVGWLSLCIDDPFTPVFGEHQEETVVVALSVSGETEQVLGMANGLKTKGCRLISITNTPNCTLARMSDCNISYYMPVRKTARYFNITLQAPVVTILEILGNKLYRLAPERQELLSE
ncbi:MAG: MurR/RpiR family transcriptional regulator [Hungatella sp.]|nr:MurR/RpiR family transcriptional regulator [Hungatella sp.]